MAKTTKYRIIDMGTIEKKVGQSFSIKCSSPVGIESRLSFPEAEINKVGTKTIKTQNMGAGFPIQYTLKGLKPGEYLIEYQRLNRPWDKKPGQVYEAERYKVNILG